MCVNTGCRNSFPENSIIWEIPLLTMNFPRLKLDSLDSWIYQDYSADNEFPDNLKILEILLLTMKFLKMLTRLKLDSQD